MTVALTDPPPPSDGTSAGLRATDLATGVAVAVAGLTWRSARLGLRLAAPVAGVARRTLLPAPSTSQRWPQPALLRVAARGREERAAAAAALLRAKRVLVPRAFDLVLDEIDLNRLVVDRIDLDGIVSQVDIEAVIDRVDLIDLARYIIEGVDLPEIIRDSTGSMASEGIRGVRMQSMEADERVSRLIDRVLLRRQGRRVDEVVAPAPSPMPLPNGEGPA